MSSSSPSRPPPIGSGAAAAGCGPKLASMLGEDDVCEASRRMGTGIQAHEAVPAANCSFLYRPESFRDTVRFAIGLGGDTDTIAAMAVAISGACLGERAIPGPGSTARQRRRRWATSPSASPVAR